MGYNPVTDFLALIRRTNGGARVAEVPGLDYVLAALSRAGMFELSVGLTPPTSNQSETVWLLPRSQSWTGESTVYLWNAGTAKYEPASHQLWDALLAASSQLVQDVAVAGPVNVKTDARVVRVMAGVPVTLVMPMAINKVGDVLISDWANLAGTNNITIQRSGADVFPNGATSWTLAADSASICLRPVPRGYVI